MGALLAILGSVFGPIAKAFADAIVGAFFKRASEPEVQSVTDSAGKLETVGPRVTVGGVADRWRDVLR